MQAVFYLTLRCSKTPKSEIETVVKDADRYILFLEAREFMTNTEGWSINKIKPEDKLWYTKPSGVAETLYTTKLNALLQEAKR